MFRKTSDTFRQHVVNTFVEKFDFNNPAPKEAFLDVFCELHQQALQNWHVNGVGPMDIRDAIKQMVLDFIKRNKIKSANASVHALTDWLSGHPINQGFPVYFGPFYSAVKGGKRQ